MLLLGQNHLAWHTIPEHMFTYLGFPLLGFILNALSMAYILEVQVGGDFCHSIRFLDPSMIHNSSVQEAKGSTSARH